MADCSVSALFTDRVNYAFLYKRVLTLSQLLAIAAGGAMGAVLRFLMSNGVYRLTGNGFPYGTLVINVLGSFVLGMLFVMLLEKLMVSAEWRLGLTVGLIGSFTTFSTFSIETLLLIEEGHLLKAALNIVLSVTLCLSAAWLGMGLGRQL